MATARKLPSGNWRVLCYDGMGANGKRKYQSFTAATKKEAERLAVLYMASAQKTQDTKITVSEAIDRYINAKTGVLSASTIRGYRQMQRRYYDGISRIDIFKLTTEEMQKFVASITGTASAKTVSNVYGLLSSSVAMFRPDASFRVSLPKKIKARKGSPSNADVAHLFSAAQGSLKLSIALAAFGSMRRGEICALKYGDVEGNIIHVHADMVENEHNKFEYKEIPKTSDSVRDVRVPAQVTALIDKDGPADDFIIPETPNAITSAFIKLRNKLGIDIRLHDLRHYYASVGAVLGVPDTYMSDFGGWRRGSGVMKEVYQNVIDDERQRYQDILTSHFEKVIS